MNDSGYFEDINTEPKAYFLGLIASNARTIGSGGPSPMREGALYLRLPQRELRFLEYLRDSLPKTSCAPLGRIGTTGSIQRDAKKGLVLEIGSVDTVRNISRALGVDKFLSREIRFPVHLELGLRWIFVRGVFDGGSKVFMKDGVLHVHKFCLSKRLRKGIIEFTQFGFEETGSILRLSGFSAVDFMDRMYAHGSFPMLYSEFKHKQFMRILDTSLTSSPIFKVRLRDPEAVMPVKFRSSDAGFDLTVIRRTKTVGKTEFYDTGLAIVPQYGFYCKLYPRSSLSKKGYILANSTGIIDSTYTGNIIVALIKIDGTAPDLPLPYRAAQIVPERSLYPQIQRIESTPMTERGEGGFGSTSELV